MSRPVKDRNAGHDGRRPEADAEDLYPPRPRLSIPASLALPVVLGLALWGLILFFV